MHCRDHGGQPIDDVRPEAVFQGLGHGLGEATTLPVPIGAVSSKYSIIDDTPRPWRLEGAT
jgi:hypothetical protein